MDVFEDKDEFIKYESLLKTESKDPKVLADVKRKCITISNKLVDEKTANVLLEDNLKQYTDIIKSGKIYDEALKNILEQTKLVNNSFQWKSNLQNVNILSKLQNNDSKPKCDEAIKLFRNNFIKAQTNKENNSTRQINQQCNLYKRNNASFESDREPKTRTFRNNASFENDREPKTRTFSKSFAPKTCNNTFYQKASSSKYEEIPQEKPNQAYSVFRSARDELSLQNEKKYGNKAPPLKKKLGTRRGLGSKFVSPMLSNTDLDSGEDSSKSQEMVEEIVDERLKNIEPKMVELIKSEIMDSNATTDWNDIAGLEFAKNAIQEAVVWPMLRPDIFTGLRRPPKGILLFGPPGTGKTLIGKCVASQSKSTFFSISASSLTSKWVGDGEKMVRALFAVSRCYQPAVIFIDEIDSLLSQRSDTEHESSRRIKTEFLVQLDGATTDNDERLLVIGATNRPQELDEAARRRFVKRLYIPLPELQARLELINKLMSTERHSLTENNVAEIAKLSDGYSGADMRNLCSDACLGPIRSIDMKRIEVIQAAEVRPVAMEDFRKALNRVRSSVSPKDLDQYILWDKTYGSGCF